MASKRGLFYLHSNRLLSNHHAVGGGENMTNNSGTRSPSPLKLLMNNKSSSQQQQDNSHHSISTSTSKLIHSVNPATTPELIMQHLNRELAMLNGGIDSSNNSRIQNGGGGGSPTSNDVDLTRAYHELQVYRETFGMIVKSVPSYATLLERILKGFDTFIERLERKDDSVAAAKAKVYDEFKTIFEQQERKRSAEHQELLAKLKSSEEEIEYRHKDHADQLRALQVENERLKSQGTDDHDRCLVLSQSVVELRLALQRAESRVKDYDDHQARLVESQQRCYEFQKECLEMMRIMKKNHVSYQSSLRAEWILMMQQDPQGFLLMSGYQPPASGGGQQQGTLPRLSVYAGKK